MDPDALEEFLTRKDGSKKSLQEQTIRATYYVTPDAFWRLEKFLLEDLLIDGGRTADAMINDTPGRQVLAHMTHQASDDGQQVYSRLKSTAPVE